MTPAECLAKVLASPEWRQMAGVDGDDIYGQLAIAVAELAIAAEREACATIASKVADQWRNSYREDAVHPSDVADGIAVDIRARGEKT